jgi:cation diffusion facilitator family transporter
MNRNQTQHTNATKSILYALGANLAIALAKLFGAWLTASGAMLAEALHSIADSGNQALLMWGLRQAKLPPSSVYPLGHGRAIYFWSFIVALILFSMGGVFSIYEGVHKLEVHEGLESPWLAIVILVFALVAEGISLSVVFEQVNTIRGPKSLWRWFRDTRQSELIVVLGEDVAALVGLLLALGAVALTMITGDPVYDAWGSIAIGVLLVIVALGLGAEIKGLLIGQSAEPDTQGAIAAFLSQRQEIQDLLNLITLQQGDYIMVAIKARMQDTATVRELLENINRCEAALKQAFPQVTWIFFEPDYE